MREKTQENYRDFAHSLNKVLDAIRSNRVLAPIIVYGPSAYLIYKTCNSIRDAWDQARNDQAEYQSFEADDLGEELCNNLVDQQSLFQLPSLYLIKRCEKKITSLLSGPLRLVGEENQNQWVFAFSPSERLPPKVGEQLQKMKSEFVYCVDPSVAELARFVLSLAKRFGVNLSQDAAQLIIVVCGNDLFQIDNELSKIALIHCGKESVVTAQDLAPFLNVLREDHAFELTNLILKRQGASAQLLLESLLARGESGLAILGILSRHCRNAISISELVSRRSSLRDIAAILRLPHSVVTLYNDYIRHQSHESFAKILLECARADGRLKTSKISDEILLSSLIVSMT